MATKIVLTVEEGLTKQEVEDLRYLLTDALGEFAARRTPARDYVENRYPGSDVYPGALREKNVQQVERRNALAKKLHDVALHFEVEHAEPHGTVPLRAYYRACGEEDRRAMDAAADLIEGAFQGWSVRRESNILLLEGPEGQQAFWHEIGQRWMWLEEPKAVAS